MELSGKLDDGVVSAPDGDEAQLVARARQGDEWAWARLVRAHQEPVFRLAYLILSRGTGYEAAAGAEDVAQETFVRAFLKLEQYDDTRPLRPWLLGIAANLARNRRRSLGRYWAALQRWWREYPQSATSEPDHQQRADAEILWQAVQKLRPAARETIYVYYFLELSEAETAQVLGVAPGTVKSRLYRARQQLETIIEEEFPALYAEWQR